MTPIDIAMLCAGAFAWGLLGFAGAGMIIGSLDRSGLSMRDWQAITFMIIAILPGPCLFPAVVAVLAAEASGK